jgi:hypothetical protein
MSIHRGAEQPASSDSTLSGSGLEAGAIPGDAPGYFMNPLRGFAFALGVEHKLWEKIRPSGGENIGQAKGDMGHGARALNQCDFRVSNFQFLVSNF